MTWCMSWSGDCNAVLMKTCHRKHHLLVFQTSSWMAWEYVVVWWLWCCFNENLRSAAIRNIISWPFKPLHGWPDTYQTTLLIHCGGIHSHKGVGVWWFWCCLNKSIGTPTAKNIISLSVKLLYGCVCVCVCARMSVRARACVCVCMYSDGRCQGVVIVMLCLSKNFELMQSETHIVVCETCLWMTWHRAFYNAEDAPAAWRVVTWHVPVFLQDALPGVSSRSILQRLYPYSLMLGKEGKTAVNDTLQVRLSCLVLFHVLPSFVMSCPVLLCLVMSWACLGMVQWNPWWETTLMMTEHFDERPSWWETTMMRDHCWR